MRDAKTISAYDAQIDNYLDVLKKQPADDQLLRFIKRFNANDYILDLGCGPAVSSATMRDAGLRVDPTDASVEMVNLANETYGINARQVAFHEIKAVNTYDGIWANFSLLHATRVDLPSILQLLHRALKSGGVFYMCMKLGEGSTRDKFDRFYTYYSEAELRELLAAANFSVVSADTGEVQGMAGTLEPWVAVWSIA
jgi:predicted TPR repeat methyltransferase